MQKLLPVLVSDLGGNARKYRPMAQNNMLALERKPPKHAIQQTWFKKDTISNHGNKGYLQTDMI